MLLSVPGLAEWKGMLMSTYEEFMVIFTTALLIVAIPNLKMRNSRLVLCKSLTAISIV